MYAEKQIAKHTSQLLAYHSLAISHFAATEHYLFCALCRLITHPSDEIDAALFASLHGASVRPLLQHVSSMTRARLGEASYSEVANACKKLEKAFGRRNWLAHGVLVAPERPKTLRFQSFKRKTDGKPVEPQSFSIDDLRQIIDSLQARTQEIEAVFKENGVAPLKSSKASG